MVKGKCDFLLFLSSKPKYITIFSVSLTFLHKGKYFGSLAIVGWVYETESVYPVCLSRYFLGMGS